jgi:hypothetical protein
MSDTITQLRKYKIHNIALFDLVGSVIGMEIIFRYFQIGPNYTGSLLAVPIGIVSHKLFNVNTELNYKLGLSDKPNRDDEIKQTNNNHANHSHQDYYLLDNGFSCWH